MDINSLDDTEVDALINRLKRPKNRLSFSSVYQKINTFFGKLNIEEPIIDDDDIDYFIKIYRGRIETERFSIHLRFKENHHHLVRIDVNPNINHNNPDGTKITGSHIHIYSNKYERKDAVAIPLTGSDFPNINTIIDAFTNFLSYNNIK